MKTLTQPGARWRKPLLCGLAAFALATVAAAVLVCSYQIRESWYLFRLRSEDSKVREDAREGLVRLGSVRAVPVFLKDPQVYPLEAARILASLSPDRMHQLAVLLLGEEDHLYLKVVRLHHEANAPAAPLARFLKVALKHPNPGVRRYAAEELSRLGAEAAVALKEIEDARQDEAEEVRFWADLALKETRFATGR